MGYKIIVSPQARDDFYFFRKSGNVVAVRKIEALMRDISEHPFTGIGKPEPLRYDLSGKWSRHITSGHRMVYQFLPEKMAVEIISMRFHYDSQ